VSAASLPLADAGSLRSLARRTRVRRLALGGLLIVVAASAVLLARGPHVSAGLYAPPGTNTIVVLDVSASVEFNKLQLAYSTLSFLGHSKARVGLVVCSSYAYEALPPGSPASTLLPIAKLFHPTGIRRGAFGGPTFILPPNPWKAAFGTGTELSSGLELARSVIVTGHLRQPSVVLISDLLDDANDLPRIKAEGQLYQQDGIPLRIVGLDPTLGDLQYFLKAAGRQGAQLQPKVPKQAVLRLHAGFPTALAIVTTVLAFLIAIDEVLFAPLRWGATRLVRDSQG
jgi:hypothetical protein